MNNMNRQNFCTFCRLSFLASQYFLCRLICLKMHRRPFCSLLEIKIFFSRNISEMIINRQYYYTVVSQQAQMQLSSFKDKYTILEKVQEGSYGVIYKARNNQSKQIVAVKKFKALNKVGLPISFVRERFIFETLSGKHLVRVLETFVGQEEPMMVMEWLTTNLDRIVSSKKKFAIKEIFHEILKGVQEFHSSDFIHRDLKPSNIMLAPKNPHNLSQPEPADIDTNNYNIKIIDLGMAKELQYYQKSMTNMVGSLFYRAPELLMGSRMYGAEVDVWALGCIFHFMVTGFILFKGESQIDQLQRIIDVVGIKKNSIKSHFVLAGLEKLKCDDRMGNWEETLKLMNEIQFDFLGKMVVLDPESRLTCRQLLNHPYFT